MRNEITVVGAAPALVKMGYNYHFKGNISLPVDSNYHERSLKQRLSGGIREFLERLWSKKNLEWENKYLLREIRKNK